MLNNNLTNATTIWESWFFSDNTFSHDHPMFGSVEVYLMQGLGGIQPHPAAVGFDKVLIKPRPPPALSSFGATYRSVRGTIAVKWAWATAALPSASGGVVTRKLELTVVIPPNVKADIHVPSAPGTMLEEEEDNHRLMAAVVEADANARATILSRGSGTHRFTSSVQI